MKNIMLNENSEFHIFTYIIISELDSILNTIMTMTKLMVLPVKILFLPLFETIKTKFWGKKEFYKEVRDKRLAL